MSKVSVKKVFSIIFTVLTALIIALAAIVIINMIYCRAKNKPVSFFGTSFALVQTNSMEPYIMTGDLIAFHACSFEDVKPGDYVVFIAGDGFGRLKGQSIVHAVKEITADGIITQGLNGKTNPQPDKDLVTSGNLLGICNFNSAGWGKVFGFINRYGILIIILAVAVPFIVQQVIKIIKIFKQKKSEKLTTCVRNCESGDSGNGELPSSDKKSDHDG